MKYKRLTLDELQEMEPEFVQYLAAQQITAPEWVTMKENDMERVDELIDVFSDMVFERVLQKIKYVEHVSRQDLMVFHCKEHTIHMVAVQLTDESSLDLTDPDFFEQLAQLDNKAGVSFYAKENPYAEEREKVIFQLLESGCSIAKEEVFNEILEQSKVQ